MTETHEASRPANDTKDVAPAYQPLGLRDVIAAALMMKRPANDKAGNKPQKVA